MRYYFLSLVVLGSVLLGGCPPPVDPPPVDPTLPSASIGNLEVVGRPFCLTGFNACETLGGYESLARAFYHHINGFTGTPVSATIGTTGSDDILGRYFPTITTSGGTAINPLDTNKPFVTVGLSLDPFNDVLLAALDATEWNSVSGVDGGGFVLANDVTNFSEGNNDPTLYVVSVDYSAADNAPDCNAGEADTCIAVRSGIGSKDISTDKVQDLYVLGSGFVMLKVLFPDDLNAKRMFDIVENTQCRDNGNYFSFDCVVNGDNIDISSFTPSISSPIGNLEVVGSSCLTGFNACETLGGYEPLARAFYQYVDGFTGTQVSTAIGTTLTNGSTVLGGYFPTITTSGGTAINPLDTSKPFVTVSELDVSASVDSLPDVLVVPVALVEYQWIITNSVGGGFVLANDVTNLAEDNNATNLYVVNVNHSADSAPDCRKDNADACITVRENIGALLSSDGTVSTGTSSNVNDLYALGSGFAMLKVLFPSALNAERMFDIVTNDNCLDSGYFSFDCVVNGDNIEIPFFNLSPIGTLVGVSSCLTGYNACVNLGGYESIARAFYHHINGFTASPIPAKISTTISEGSTALRKYFPKITPYEGTAINPLDTSKSFVTVGEIAIPVSDTSSPPLFPNVLIVPVALVEYQWLLVNAGGEGFVLANDVTNLTVANNSSSLYVVDVNYSSVEDVTTTNCPENHPADACITVRSGIGNLLSVDGTVSTGTSSDTLDLYVLGSGFAMLKALLPEGFSSGRMFNIVVNGNCRDSGYFSFKCVVNGDNIEEESSMSLIGTFEVERVSSACLTGYNACTDLGGYQSLVQAFYHYVNENKDSPPASSVTYGRVVLSDNFPQPIVSPPPVLPPFSIPTITTSGGDIDPTAFVTVENTVISGAETDYISSFPDVLLVLSMISPEVWVNVNKGDKGFILANDVTNLAAHNSDLYVVGVNYGTEETVTACTPEPADACITVRKNIGALLSSDGTVSTGTSSNVDDLYVLGSGFAMLKALFPGDLYFRDMFNIVINDECRDSGYFSFKCVVKGDNIDISSFASGTSSSPIGTLILKIEGGRPSCLTGFNACEDLGGYESLARAFYLYVDTFDASETPEPATIGTTVTDGSTVLREYFPTITTSGGNAINPLDTSKPFVTVGVGISLNDVVLVNALNTNQWDLVGTLLSSAAAVGGGFYLANDVTDLTAANNAPNLYVVDVNYSAANNAPDCNAGDADTCIAVRSGIGSNGDTINSTLDLYVLGSGFAMLKVLFPDSLNPKNMFDIVTNAECRDSGYFSFECVVNEDNDNIDISSFTPSISSPIGNLEVVGSSCLTGFNACADLGGYESLARAFYQYVDGFTGTQVSTTIGTTLTNGSTVLGGYFPTITTSGGDIAPFAFVTVEAITVSGDADNALASLHDVFVVPEALDATQWSNVSGAEGEGFVLANDVETLTEETNDNIYIVDVAYSAEDDALSCSAGIADACITVRENIGALLNSDGTVSTGTSSDTLDLYVLGSGFAMLKVLFPDDLDAEGMFDIVTNAECRDTNGYFSFECLVIDNTRIVPTVPEEESTSGEASSSQNKPLTSVFARLLVRSLAARHAPSKDGTYFTQEKTVLEEGSILITQQGTSSTSATSATSGTSVRAIRMRAVYRGEGASVGTLVGAYRYNHTLSALSRDAVDMRVELGMVGDVDVLSGLKLYGHILGVYETGVLTVAFGEHRVDRMMGVGVVGLSYRVSSGANVLADAAIEGRCSVGNAVWVAGSVAYASSFCDTILKLRISF